MTLPDPFQSTLACALETGIDRHGDLFRINFRPRWKAGGSRNNRL